MHKLIKLAFENPPAVVWTSEMRRAQKTSTDQANADAQRKKWKPIWEGKDKEATRIAKKAH